MSPKHVRPAAVAGMFYPADEAGLAAQVDSFLDQAPQTTPNGSPPIAILVPHAGYVYSGAIAGRAYALWRHVEIKHVLIIGPTHRVGVPAVVLPDVDAMETPLGDVPLWREGVASVLRLEQVIESDAVHEQEHSLEVQLPFLQRVLDDFDVLPLAAGWVTPQMVAEVIEALWATPDLGIVISSDLSHYHSYADARDIDHGTIDQVLALDPGIDHDQACGATGLDAMMLVAARHHLAPRLLGMCNSGDTAGDKRRVVGYAAVAFDKKVVTI